MTNTAVLFTRAVACLLLLVFVAAQGPGQPVIRVVTRLVDVSVIARNASGPVADLTADDFTVFDNGVEKKIAFFSVNSARAPQQPVAPAAPNVFTNQPELRTDAPVRLSVVVLDGLNAAFEYQSRARTQFLKFAHDLGPRDRVAVYALGTRLTRVQDFTNDCAQLIASVERYWPNVALAPPDAAAAAARAPVPGDAQHIAASMRTANLSAMEYYRMRVTTDLIKDMAQEIGRIPGRKNIIWLSTGFPMEIQMQGDHPGQPTSFREELSGAGRALARSGAALYPVDVKGLVAPAGGQNASAVSVSEKRRHDSMDELAELTGGRAFYDRNDLAEAIRDAIDDTEVTYTIGFYPDSAAQDGAYHRLQLAVKRKGVDLRYRQGYLAADAPVPTAEADGRESIHNALANPLDVTGIALNVRLQPPDPKKPRALRMTIAIPGRGIAGPVDVVVAQHAANGHDLATFGDVVKPASGEGILIRREVALQPGVSRLRVVVFDRGSGRLGSLAFPPPK